MEMNVSTATDEMLLDMIQRVNSHAAFTELLNRHALRFRKLAFRFTNSVSDAEDIVQEAFLALWQRPDMWDGGKSVKFTTWFYRVITNRCLDQARKKRPLPMPEEDVFEDNSEPADAAIVRRERESSVEAAFRDLPQPMQTALNLSFYEPVPNKEAADIMGLSLKAFQSLLMRAKSTLRERIMDDKQENGRRYATR